MPYFEREIAEIWVGNIEFDFLTGLYFWKEGEQVFLRGSMPDHQQMNGRPYHCSKYNRSKNLCASWYPKVKLEVVNTVEEHGSCLSMTWTTLLEEYQPHTCFSMSDVHWYGGSLLTNQQWPLNKVDLQLQPYKLYNSHSLGEGKDNIGSVLDWFWISSSGVAVIADSSLPLQISVNQSGDKLLCLYAPAERKAVLKYTVCKAQNVRKIQRFVLNKFVHLPVKVPNEELFNKSAWSTFPQYRGTLDQANLLQYAGEVSGKEMDRSFIDIHDFPLSFVSKEQFPESKFSNSHQSLMYLRGEYGFKTFLSLSPFVPVKEQIETSLLVSDMSHKPLVLNYNGLEVNVLNIVDEKAFNWFVNRIKDVHLQYSLDGFHILDGHIHLQNHDYLSVVDSVAFASSLAKVAVEIKIQTITTFAVRSQKSGALILLSSKSSSWSYNGGLRSVIPSALTLGILGYPFIIPNIVGGPGSDNTTGPEVKAGIPDKELYLRWLGLSAYMPCMMFSYPPWLYDDEVMNIAKHFTRVHRETVAPLVTKAAREYEISGELDGKTIKELWPLFEIHFV